MNSRDDDPKTEPDYLRNDTIARMLPADMRAIIPPASICERTAREKAVCAKQNASIDKTVKSNIEQDDENGIREIQTTAVELYICLIKQRVLVLCTYVVLIT